MNISPQGPQDASLSGSVLHYLSVLLVTLVFAAFAGCSAGNEDVIQFGGMAPAFNSIDLSGSGISLDKMKGNPVVLRFFVPNCRYCRADTKIFNEYFKKYSGKGLKIIYINTNEQSAEVRKFVDELGILFPVVLDHDQKIAKLYRVKIVPQTIVLDPDHKIVGAILGGVSEAELDDLLLKFLP
jgi:peroxiredoxin